MMHTVILLRWAQAGGRRHARIVLGEDENRDPEPGTAFKALCGETVTPARGDIIALGGLWLDPTCLGCETAWLALPATDTGLLRVDLLVHELVELLANDLVGQLTAMLAHSVEPLVEQYLILTCRDRPAPHVCTPAELPVSQSRAKDYERDGPTRRFCGTRLERWAK